jgi:hypothetical protein
VKVAPQPSTKHLNLPSAFLLLRPASLEAVFALISLGPVLASATPPTIPVSPSVVPPVDDPSRESFSIEAAAAAAVAALVGFLLAVFLAAGFFFGAEAFLENDFEVGATSGRRETFLVEEGLFEGADSSRR